MDLPEDASRDDILAAMNTVPETDTAARQELLRRFAPPPPRPAIKMRHGARPGTADVFEGGR